MLPCSHRGHCQGRERPVCRVPGLQRDLRIKRAGRTQAKRKYQRGFVGRLGALPLVLGINPSRSPRNYGVFTSCVPRQGMASAMPKTQQGLGALAPGVRLPFTRRVTPFVKTLSPHFSPAWSVRPADFVALKGQHRVAGGNAPGTECEYSNRPRRGRTTSAGRQDDSPPPRCLVRNLL